VEQTAFSANEIYEKYLEKNVNFMPIGSLHTTLSRMVNKGCLSCEDREYSLTEEGKKELTKYLTALGIQEIKSGFNRYKTFFNQMNDPVLVCPLSEDFLPGKIIDANHASTRVLGYSLEELKNLTPMDFECPASFDKHISSTVEQMKLSYTAHFESAFFTKSHKLMYFETRVTVFDWGDQSKSVVATLRDITDRKIVEKEIAETVERLKLAMWGTDLGIWDWEIQTGRINYSQRWIEMLGYSQDEIEPNYSAWKSLIHPDDLPQTLEILRVHLSGKTTSYEAQFRMKAKNGEWILILARGKVVDRDADGKPLRATGTHKHIKF